MCPAPTARTRVRRQAERADYDRDTLYAIVDAAHLCHLAFADDTGVHALPMACWRIGDQLYLHGSNGSRMLKHAVGGAQVCATITHLDGLVLARSAFNHTMNYRSAAIYGVCERVADADKPAVLDALMDKLAPGRSRQARPGNAQELAATTVLRLPLNEFACKVRQGGPEDDADDLALPVWAGVLPLRLAPQPAQADSDFEPTPDYVRAWR